MLRDLQGGLVSSVHALKQSTERNADPSRESSHQFASGPLCTLEERLLVERRVAVHHQVGECDCLGRRLAIARDEVMVRGSGGSSR